MQELLPVMDVSALTVTGESSITGNLFCGIAAHVSADADGDDWSCTDLAVVARRAVG